MEKLFIITSLLFMMCLNAEAVLTEQYWAKTYEDAGISTSIQQTSDGGFIVAGHTDYIGTEDEDIWVRKLDVNGSIIWQKTYKGNDTDEACAVLQTIDGGYVVVGNTHSFGAGERDAWVLKLDSSGNVTWQKTYGGSDFDSAHYILQTSDGAYIMVGNSAPGIWVLKLANNGNIIWEKVYGDGGVENGSAAHYIKSTSDGGYILMGQSTLPSGDIWGNIIVLKLDSDGAITWQKIYGGPGGDFGESIEETQEGEFIIGATTYSFGIGFWYVWLLRLDADGEVLLQKMYRRSTLDETTAIMQTTEGDYIVGASTNYGEATWVLELSTSGDVIWQKIIDGSDSGYLTSFQEASDHGYSMTGLSHTRRSVVWVQKSDSNVDIPECDLMVPGDFIEIVDTSITGQNTNLTEQPHATIVTTTNAIPQDISTNISVSCSYNNPDDSDADGILNSQDNCPDAPNYSYLGTCIGANIGQTCIADVVCGVGGFCSMNQDDNYPPGGNNCGDACECHADCNGDQKVDLADLVIMKQQFLWNCSQHSSCEADCNYDNSVDLADLVMMKGEFNRTDCPACP